MSEVHVLVFALILLRMIAFIVASPVFGGPQISTPTKILLALVLTLCMYPLLPVDLKVYDGLANDIIVLAGREILVGLLLGYICRLFFFAISMTGELVSISLGLSSAQMYNPLIGSQGNIMEQFYSILGMLFFFMINGHHMLIGGLVQSFDFVKVGLLTFNVAPLGELALVGQTLLVITVKLCAPVMVAILLSHIAMGLLGRAIPQVNVLITSFPVTILLGLVVILICVPLYLNGLGNIMDIVADQMLHVMKTI